MIKHKKLSCLLIPACLLIFTLIWRNINIKEHYEFKIGIIQFVEHEALDASRNGFIDGLKREKFNVKINYKNAQGDQANCTLIANQFISENYDIILAIGTPAAECVAAATSKIPILVVAVTNPEESGLVRSNEKPETNVTGVSDLPPISKQISLIKDLKPKAQKIGILFSSSEANSGYQAKKAYEESKKIGLKSEFFTFSQMTEIQQVVESMIGKVDAIYTPTDNMVATNMKLISKVALQNKIPVICGDENLICKGAVGTFGVDYYELGKIAATQALDILTNKNTPQNMNIKYVNNSKLSLNYEILDKLGIKLSEKLKGELQ